MQLSCQQCFEDRIHRTISVALVRRKIFLLADAAQFYVSCERVFQASLHMMPTIILSNNDGCIVAISQEAKRLGLKRGQPPRCSPVG